MLKLYLNWQYLTIILCFRKIHLEENAKKILGFEHFSLQSHDIEKNCLLTVNESRGMRSHVDCFPCFGKGKIWECGQILALELCIKFPAYIHTI
jgi:hypothetical protein